MTKEEKLNETLNTFRKSIIMDVTYEQIENYLKDLFKEYIDSLKPKKIIKPEIKIRWIPGLESMTNVLIPVDEKYRLVLSDKDGGDYFIPYAIIPMKIQKILYEKNLLNVHKNKILRICDCEKMIYLTSHKNDYKEDIPYEERKFEEFSFNFELEPLLYHVCMELNPDKFPYKHLPCYNIEISENFTSGKEDPYFRVKFIYF